MEQQQYQKKYLTELEGVLFAWKAEIAADKDKHSPGSTRGLTINGVDLVLALLERQTGELTGDTLSPLILLTLKRQYRAFLVDASKSSPIGIEGGVVVVHKCLRYGVGIHQQIGKSVALLLTLICVCQLKSNSTLLAIERALFMTAPRALIV